mgnify:CR=1 FL=1
MSDPAHGVPILEVSRLRKTYVKEAGFLRRKKGEVRAVDDISFAVAKGETLALVGESGCGKTTTGLCIVRSEEPTSGSIFMQDGVSRKDILTLEGEELKQMRKDIRVVFQDPFSSLNPRMTVLRIIGEPLINDGLVKGKAELRDKVAQMMSLVQLDPVYMSRYPHSFSGGQRQRIAIARALVLNPKIVIADEPVSALDVSVQAQILNLMRELQKREHITYVFIAHNLAVVRYLSDRVAIMYLGKIVELSERDEIFSRPQHPYTELLLASSPNPDPDAKKIHLVPEGEIPSYGNRPAGCPFHPRCRYSQERCETESPQLEDANVPLGREDAAGGLPSHLVACHFHSELHLEAYDQ